MSSVISCRKHQTSSASVIHRIICHPWRPCFRSVSHNMKAVSQLRPVTHRVQSALSWVVCCHSGQSAVSHDVTAVVPVRQFCFCGHSGSSKSVMSALVPGCGPRTRTAASTGRSTTALPRRRTSSPSIPSPGSSLSPAPSSTGRRPRILKCFINPCLFCSTVGMLNFFNKWGLNPFRCVPVTFLMPSKVLHIFEAK